MVTTATKVYTFLDDASVRLAKVKAADGATVARKVRATAKDIADAAGKDFITEDDVFASWRQVCPERFQQEQEEAQMASRAGGAVADDTFVDDIDQRIAEDEDEERAAEEFAVAIGTMVAMKPQSPYSPVEALIVAALEGATEPLTKAQIGRMQPELKKKSGSAVKVAYDRLLKNGHITAVADGFVLVGATNPQEQLVGRIVALVKANGGAAAEIDAVKSAIKGMGEGEKASVRAKALEQLNGKSATGIFVCLGLVTLGDTGRAQEDARAKQEAAAATKKGGKARTDAVGAVGAMLQITPELKARPDSTMGAATLLAYAASAEGAGTISFDDIRTGLEAGIMKDVPAAERRGDIMRAWRLLRKRGVCALVGEALAAKSSDDTYRMADGVAARLKSQGVHPDGTLDDGVVRAAVAEDIAVAEEEGEDDETTG
jgi:hypothetical protein